jgi:hypothetical protein
MAQGPRSLQAKTSCEISHARRAQTVSSMPKPPCLFGERLRALEAAAEEDEQAPEDDEESLDSLSDALLSEGATPHKFGIRALL